MPTIWTSIGALAFDSFTTVQRDALVAQERMVIYNSTTSRFEIYVSGSWRDFSEYIGTVGLSEHEVIASGNLHPEYAHPHHPEEITGTWMLKSGGRLTPVSGDVPEGEVVIQVKTTTGAPAHSASRGVFCLVTPDSTLYLNMVGGTTWVLMATDADITAAVAAHVAAGDPHSVYLTQAEGDALYEALGDIATHAALATGVHGAGGDTLATDADIAAHAAIAAAHHAKYLDSEAVAAAKTVKLDDFTAPDDNTDLDATTSKHGLLKKLGGGTINFLRADGSWAAPVAAGKASKSYLFEYPDEDMAVGDFIPQSAIRIPAAGKHGDITWGTAYARCVTVGTGTNTILFRTSTTLTGARTTRATINLGTSHEASGAITLTESDGMYLWVACSVVGATAPKKVTVQVDCEETIY